MTRQRGDGIAARRVCVLLHGYYPLDARVRREALAAVGAGAAVDVICLRLPNECAVERVEGVNIRRVRLKHVPGGGARRVLFEYLAFTFVTLLLLLPAALRRRYSVVHVNNPPDFLILSALVPAITGARLVFDVHDFSWLMFATRVAGLPGRLGVAILKPLERAACAVSDVVLTVHEPYREALTANGVPSEKIVIVMNTFDERLMDLVPPYDSMTAGGFSVGYCGTLSPWHSVDLLLDAFELVQERLPHARMVILGDGDQRSTLEARVTRPPLAGAVELSDGWLPSELALARIAGMNCGVIPNRPTPLTQLALSSKLFEYIALGVPAVVARLKTEEAHFSDKEVTFFEPGSAEALAMALQWVAEHPREARAKVGRARERVAREYSWADNAARYVTALTAGGR